MKTRHWADINEATSVLGIKFLFAVYRLLGRPVFYLFLMPVIVYYFCFQGRARRASRDFLSRVQALGCIPADANLSWWSLRHFYCFGVSLLDKLAAWSGGVKGGYVRTQQYEEFLDYLKGGRGALLIASHLGNLEVSRIMAGGHKRAKLNILVHTKHAEKFNRIMRDVDEESCMNLLQVTEITPATAVMLSEKIEAGEVVVIAGDRTPVGGGGRHSIVDFLGAPAVFPQGPYILASLLRCPVYTIFCVRDRGGYNIAIEPFADSIRLSRKTRDAELQHWSQSFADWLEELALRYPLQWFNFYDFWWLPAEEPAAEVGTGQLPSSGGSRRV